MRHPVYNNDGSFKRHGGADALAFSERHFALVAKFRSCRLTKARAHLNLSMETQLHHPFMRSPVGGDHDSRLSVHSPFRNNGLCRCQRASAQKQVDGEDPVRLRIVDDLIKSKRLDSLSRADIVKLLGEPAAADY